MRQYLTTTQKLRKTRFLNLTQSLNQNSPISVIIKTILSTHIPAMRHWPPGQQLHNGKYIIEAILGGGGFGVTYRAQNPKEGKVVAIKTLNANVQGKPNFREYQTKFVSVQEWLDLLIPKPVAAETTRVISAVGMDYINLRNLLAAKKWQEADDETLRVMVKVAGREKEGWLDVEHIEKFPCEDLRTIDQLWVKYSNGRFGFSVQKRIYQSLGGTREYDEEIWNKFGDQVGWRKKNEWVYYNDLTFSEKAPEAHLPLVDALGRYSAFMLYGLEVSLLSRRDL